MGRNHCERIESQGHVEYMHIHVFSKIFRSDKFKNESILSAECSVKVFRKYVQEGFIAKAKEKLTARLVLF